MHKFATLGLIASVLTFVHPEATVSKEKGKPEHAPGKGNKYIRVDNEILEIAEDTQTVIDAVGIVDDLLK